MCGYVGEISLAEPVSRPRLYRMNNTLIHRGPDESGIVIAPNGRWGVAHRRLAVIDLAGGKQPMVDAAHGLTLVFNGEIYDHDRLRHELAETGYPFHTTSDTEVILALYSRYGLELFEHLRGEFSFTIIDEKRREAILVRDRFGIKPLFYAKEPRRLLFASEIKALFRAPDLERRIDPAGLVAAITVTDTPGRTCFTGVKQVRPAHYLRVKLDTLEISEHRYWDAWTHRRTDLPSSMSEQIEMTRKAIDDAIGLRLRADVPIGAYLSGGIDSSLVAATMAKRIDRLEAFGLAFVDSARHDEFPYAELVANRCGNVRLHRIPVTSNDTIRRLPEAVWHMERPFGNLHSIAKIMAAQYAREYVVAVQTGDGGDESFCGYSTFWLQQEMSNAGYSLDRIRSRLAAMRKEARGIGGNRYYLAGGLARGLGPQHQVLVRGLGFPPSDLCTGIDAELRLRRLLHPDFAGRIDRPPIDTLIEQLAHTMPSADEVPHATLLQYVHFNCIVPEYITTIADRSETAGSVEARLPLFDHKVVELAMGLPIETKLKGDREKHVLKEAYKDLLPEGVIERRKQAFLAPPAPFACVDGRALLEEHLSAAAVRDAGVWDPKKIALLKLARRIAPRNKIINLILTVVMTTQLLHHQFIKQSAGR